ncbi:phospholipase [Roseobacter denitrificans]|uniref:Phospholipase D n=1 Tax=Roseobacter denitrificans (strain ATCC 33942 / OCh 114) TaxID=375451 RepID=Q166Q1_ROSDO|nr:phospholipase D family protein [Roseobacter denitrificans]ABG32042.1 phospholipase D, putative [Roseobacter denitrificans OCh 114]AVL51565.1 phospholipase [Roseobacter denitrificans]SFG36743.1 phospholipase D1/2 [Roseobacter denitrificans OCh 114]
MARLNNLQILITAQEGYRALEAAVLSAETRIDMGFRVFDPRMALVSDEAARVGTQWVDLLLAKLDDGVDITIRISDFDPVVRPELHRTSYKTLSIMTGIAEMVSGSGRLQVFVEPHPARVGWGPRIALWPKVQSQIGQTCDWLNGLSAHARTEMLRCMPRFRGFTYTKAGRIYPKRRDFPPMLPVTHHQKLAVIDDRTLYIGGLDLDERRFDTTQHDRPAEETWHDVHVLLEDSALARSARDHLDRFCAECAGERPVAPPKGLLRTLSVRREKNQGSLSPVVSDTGIMDRTLELIGQAEDLIYLENQFLRDPVITNSLCERARARPRLGLLVLLPAAPLEVAFDGKTGLDHQYGEYLQAKCLGQLKEAFGDRMYCVTPARPKEAAGSGRPVIHGAPMIFVHSKVSIFDDRAGLVTSANLNGRSMRWDTELGLEIDDPAQVSHLRNRVMSAWLAKDAGPHYRAPQLETVDLWRALAQQNAASVPTERRGFLLPYDVSRARDFGTRLPGIPVEMV